MHRRASSVATPGSAISPPFVHLQLLEVFLDSLFSSVELFFVLAIQGKGVTLKVVNHTLTIFRAVYHLDMLLAGLQRRCTFIQMLGHCLMEAFSTISVGAIFSSCFLTDAIDSSTTMLNENCILFFLFWNW